MEKLERQLQKLQLHYDRVCAYVDLDAIIHNYEQMKNCVDQKTQLIGVIKTDGYGHGAIAIARQLEKISYVWGYATATPEEAFILRDAGIKKPILILGYTFPYAYPRMIAEDIRPALFRPDSLPLFEKAAQDAGKKAKVHIKVDTAMSRIGIFPDESGMRFIRELKECTHLEIEGIFTHFAKADMADLTPAREQFARFRDFVNRVEHELSLSIPMKHCSNSAAGIRMREANMDAVRVGITQYGLMPSDEIPADLTDLKPALSLKSRIVYVKEIPAGTQISYGGTFEADKAMRIATIPVGYGDGYPRALSQKGWVLIRGQRAQICGRVCMDQLMVDVSHIPQVMEGDIVTLIGRDGGESISMEQLGALSGRFNYELACDLGKRIPKVFIKNNSIVAAKDYIEDTALAVYEI
ncbi:MAG: alanine racemase [Lachnospiraceae bacterium]|nr:alanine racemase [Lachnospiraceae bacterium]